MSETHFHVVQKSKTTYTVKCDESLIYFQKTIIFAEVSNGERTNGKFVECRTIGTRGAPAIGAAVLRRGHWFSNGAATGTGCPGDDGDANAYANAWSTALSCGRWPDTHT